MAIFSVLLLLIALCCTPSNAFSPYIPPISSLQSRTATSIPHATNYDDDDNADVPYRIPVDVKYLPRNVKRFLQSFLAIREAGGVEMTNDVYVRKSDDASYWFIGKIARISDVSVDQAVARLWPLMEAHACKLRPVELFAHRGELEMWVAPGDSENAVVNEGAPLSEMAFEVEDAASINRAFVGFQGHMAAADDDAPIRAIRGANDEAKDYTKLANDQDMDEIMKKMKGMDISELYKEQERRAGREVDDD